MFKLWIFSVNLSIFQIFIKFKLIKLLLLKPFKSILNWQSRCMFWKNFSLFIVLIWTFHNLKFYVIEIKQSFILVKLSKIPLNLCLRIVYLFPANLNEKILKKNWILKTSKNSVKFIPIKLWNSWHTSGFMFSTWRGSLIFLKKVWKIIISELNIW